jgi:hypothetical protein
MGVTYKKLCDGVTYPGSFDIQSLANALSQLVFDGLVNGVKTGWMPETHPWAQIKNCVGTSIWDEESDQDAISLSPLTLLQGNLGTSKTWAATNHVGTILHEILHVLMGKTEDSVVVVMREEIRKSAQPDDLSRVYLLKYLFKTIFGLNPKAGYLGDTFGSPNSYGHGPQFMLVARRIQTVVGKLLEIPHLSLGFTANMNILKTECKCVQHSSECVFGCEFTAASQGRKDVSYMNSNPIRRIFVAALMENSNFAIQAAKEKEKLKEPVEEVDKSVGLDQTIGAVNKDSMTDASDPKEPTILKAVHTRAMRSVRNWGTKLPRNA